MPRVPVVVILELLEQEPDPPVGVVQIEPTGKRREPRREHERAADAIALDHHRQARLRAQLPQQVGDGGVVGAGERIARHLHDRVADAKALGGRVAAVADLGYEHPIADGTPRPPVVDHLDAPGRQEPDVRVLDVQADAAEDRENLAQRASGADALPRARDERVEIDAADHRVVVVLDQVLVDLVEHLQAALSIDLDRLRRGGRGQAQSQAQHQAAGGERTGDPR